ncbi:proline--tRNA ligase [Methanoplanus sp. FWC-SCC4]|uniref:Proline--tRNA ligase n=1 Tax=Methanochimaera problematica TaxID=2609417 RepID=A0AA97FC83_9EURY|nr:proline--tRNA ligase [Methanoplanus sp. FWC-SCC4]WOF15857.1 proline--tRNA ligase [Methanoplanus sp. FWC-SCC4]
MAEDSGVLPPKENFSEWYNDILWRAEIMDVRYPVKGVYVWYPHGFSLRRSTYSILRELLDRDHEETLFPLLIPENEFMKEAEHIKGFEEEVYWVTHGGTSELDVKLALRPTSETAIYPMYSLWVRSHADLPIKYYQIVNTFRYETKHTRPLIRLREITSFKEAHTVHATWEDAENQVEDAIALYREFYDRLCIPVIISKRPDWDKFPGADYTIATDAIMPDGKTLQVGTVHHLGDHFSKTFEMTFEDENGEQKYAFQTCYGISERCIAALISVHGDDKGLVLPPEVSPVQIVIVPIIIKKRAEEVIEAAQQLEKELKDAGYRVKTDSRDLRPGAKYYHWEMRGVPLRIEIGPRDIDNGVVMSVNRYGEKATIERDNIISGIESRLEDFRDSMTERALSHAKEQIKFASNLEEAKEAVKSGVAIIQWCGSEDCADEIEKKLDVSVLGNEVRLDFIDNKEGVCPICGKPAKPAIVARTY